MIRDYKDLVSQGLGNAEACGFHELADPVPVELVASCTSNACCSYQEKRINKNGNLRIVSKMLTRARKPLAATSDTLCYDCGSALIWERLTAIPGSRSAASAEKAQKDSK